MNESAKNTLGCTNPGCDVATTKICADGHEPIEACPFYGSVAAKIENDNGIKIQKEGEDQDQGETQEITTFLPAGEALDEEDLEKFHRSRPTFRVAIVGERDSGKSTLIYSIYNQFLKAPFASRVFAGSHSLLALERLSHLARIESGNSKPDTKRTHISEGIKYFHLKTVSENDFGDRLNLMFSDRAGESYKRARNDSNHISRLTEVQQSDIVLLLLDGARIADPTERSGAIQSVRQMLRALIDGKALGPNSIVQVVTTKIDYFIDHDDNQIISSRLDEFKKNLSSDFAHHLKELSYWEIAARDPKARFDPAYGVNDLLSNWTLPRKKIVPRAKLQFQLSSEFDRLLSRTPMEQMP